MNRSVSIAVVLIIALLSFSGCTTLAGVAGTSAAVESVNVASEGFEKQMNTFLDNWPLLSGVLEGYFAYRTGDISLSMRQARESIDKLKPGEDGKWAKRDMGLAFGYSCNLFNLATKDWMAKTVPKLLALIPIPGL